jgi:tetrahydromethanopterin S-methyltransferase subunit F
MKNPHKPKNQFIGAANKLYEGLELEHLAGV